MTRVYIWCVVNLSDPCCEECTLQLQKRGTLYDFSSVIYSFQLIGETSYCYIYIVYKLYEFKDKALVWYIANLNVVLTCINYKIPM